MLARLWPRSLYAQILLAAALALFAAQIVNAALLFNGMRNRAELEAATLVVGSIMARGGVEGQDARMHKTPHPLHRRRAVAFTTSDQALTPSGFSRDAALSRRAAAFLGLPQESGAGPYIAIGQIAELPAILRQKVMNRPMVRRMLRNGRRPPERALIFSLREADGSWAIASVVIRPIERGAVTALIVQTLLLYIIMLGALALVVRRISRPLARLKEGMNIFGRTGSAAPLAEEGPSDIRDLVRAYNAMQERLGSLLSEKDVMLGAIGHDLKTPLASLRVRVESVNDEAERDQMIASIDETTAILDDILSLARLGKSGEAIERTDIAALVETVLDDFPGQEELLELEMPDARIVASIRPMLLRRALRNLVANALRYGGNAAIHLASGNEGIRIVVEDNGPGIADADIEQMFEPFVRAEASRNRASGGSGLGLTIARAIARAHGGDVTLVNRAEGGLRASIHLPA
ncbi:MAG: ATP-binding protein [Sphingorhabdus sp.]